MLPDPAVILIRGVLKSTACAGIITADKESANTESLKEKINVFRLLHVVLSLKKLLRLLSLILM